MDVFKTQTWDQIIEINIRAGFKGRVYAFKLSTMSSASVESRQTPCSHWTRLLPVENNGNLDGSQACRCWKALKTLNAEAETKWQLIFACVSRNLSLLSKVPTSCWRIITLLRLLFSPIDCLPLLWWEWKWNEDLAFFPWWNNYGNVKCEIPKVT